MSAISRVNSPWPVHVLATSNAIAAASRPATTRQRAEAEKSSAGGSCFVVARCRCSLDGPPGHGLGIVDTEGAVERKPFVDEQSASFPGGEQAPVSDCVTVSKCRGGVPLVGVGGCEGGAEPGSLADVQRRLHPCGEAFGVGPASGQAEQHDHLDGDIHRSAVLGGKTLQGCGQQLDLAAKMDGLVGCGEQSLDREVVGCRRRSQNVVSDLQRRGAASGQRACGFEVQRLDVSWSPCHRRGRTAAVRVGTPADRDRRSGCPLGRHRRGPATSRSPRCR